MHFDVVTIFPELFSAITNYGISRRAIEKKLVQINFWNPRDYAKNSYGTVDDRPYGGGPGMVMMVEPLVAAIRDAKQGRQNCPVIYLSPQGQPFSQKMAQDLCCHNKIILLAGRYEGIDERVIELEVDQEISIGDYVLSGGEIPAMVLMDAIIRLLPGSLGHEESACQDSFSTDLLDHPHYSRPAVFEELSVPDVLLGGHHEKIRKWRNLQAFKKTEEKRPDLLKK